MEIKTEKEYDQYGNLIYVKEPNGEEIRYNEKFQVIYSKKVNGDEYWYDEDGCTIATKNISGKKVKVDNGLPFILKTGSAIIFSIIAVIFTRNFLAMLVGIPILMLKHRRNKDKTKKDIEVFILLGVYAIFIVLKIVSVTIDTPSISEIITSFKKETVVLDSGEKVDVGNINGFYKVRGKLDEPKYTVKGEAKAFLKNHENLFPAKNDELIYDLTDETIMYEMLESDIEEYGDKLIKLDNAYVVQKIENQLTENIVETELIVSDALWDQNYVYFVIFRGKIDVAEKDNIDLYGLPLAMGKYTGNKGNKIEAAVLAGSYIRVVAPGYSE